MLKLTGKYNDAIIMIDEIDENTKEQIESFLNHPGFAHSHIAVMSDTHSGKGAVIGFTMKTTNFIIPNIIGVDIGCGMLCVNLGRRNINLSKFDDYLKDKIPSGQTIQKVDLTLSGDEIDLNEQIIDLLNKRENLKSKKSIKDNHFYFKNSLGTLGGGNHFIEIDKDKNDNLYLIIHTGSRNFGKQIAEYHQYKAKKLIETVMINKEEYQKIYKDLEYLPLEMGGKEYLEDMKTAQKFASLNRKRIAETLLKYLDLSLTDTEHFETIHNYISFKDNIIRKGAISAHKDEKVLIPLNMRDGSLIAIGKGSQKWNFSAPHGAGRLFSRTEATKRLTMDEFTNTMDGIFTTSINLNTLDEAPQAYKPSELIINSVTETVDIIENIKPVYNFKAGE